MKFLPQIILALLIAFGLSLNAQAEPKALHFYLAAGNNYNMPGAARIGWNKWEFGQLSMGIFGAVKRNYFKESYYTLFGPMVIGVRDEMSAGFVSGIGFDYSLFVGLGIRGEILGTVEYMGHLDARGNLGISWDVL